MMESNWQETLCITSVCSSHVDCSWQRRLRKCLWQCLSGIIGSIPQTLEQGSYLWSSSVGDEDVYGVDIAPLGFRYIVLYHDSHCAFYADTI